jgi:hypothetical protein
MAFFVGKTMNPFALESWVFYGESSFQHAHTQTPRGLGDDPLFAFALAPETRITLGQPPGYVQQFPKSPTLPLPKLSTRHRSPTTNLNSIIHRTTPAEITQKDYHS